MKIKNFTQRILCCIILAASTLTSQAAERLLIVGDGVWGGWAIDNSIVMMKDETNPDLFTATVQLKANSDFKFLTATDWGNLEYRAGDATVTLSEGVAAALVSSEENPNDNKFQVAETANYDISADLAAKTLTVKKAAYQETEIKHTALWLIGSATPGGWNLGDGVKISPRADNPMVLEGSAQLNEGEMKIAVNTYTGYGQTFYQRDVTDDTKMVFGGDDNKWNITKAAKYIIVADTKNLTISITEDTGTGIADIAGETDAQTEWFTLSGVKVAQPANGVFVKRQGKKTVKVLVR